jgi:hypothetical protein
MGGHSKHVLFFTQKKETPLVVDQDLVVNVTLKGREKIKEIVSSFESSG